MFLPQNPENLKVLQTVREAQGPGRPVYLVGGAIRDALLGLPVKDLDFVVPGGSTELAQKVRKKLHGVGYSLDDERQTARVILNQGTEKEIVLDFACFVGNSLEEDLIQRDFTINAMAVKLDRDTTLIDVAGGEKDLQDRLLRTASAESMLMDPLRVLRGIRLGFAYELHMEPETKTLMQFAAKQLPRISGERIREEILKILACTSASEAYRVMDDLGCINAIFPELEKVKRIPALYPHVHPLWEHTLSVVRYLEIFLNPITRKEMALGNSYLDVADHTLRPYDDELLAWFDQPIQAKRQKKYLLMLAALYHDIGKPVTQSQDDTGRFHFYGHDNAGMEITERRFEALAFGREEISYLVDVVGQHMQVHFLAKHDGEIPDRLVYRYFRRVGDVGVDVAVLSLADMLAAYEDSLSMEKWVKETAAVGRLLEAWFEKKAEVVQPTRLLNGNALKELFHIKAGPLVGELLEQLREAQAAGEVKDYDEAYIFVREYLSKIEMKGERHGPKD